jgi:hypothetical protein
MHNGGVAAYRERVLWPGPMYLLLGLLLVGAPVALAVRVGFSWTLAIVLVPFLLTACALWRMRFLELEFGREGAAFGFGGIRRRVPGARILEAVPADYAVARFMGWGYRLGWEPRERAYSILGCRRGVRLRFEDERGRTWKIFLSSRDPEGAIAALGA